MVQHQLSEVVSVRVHIKLVFEEPDGPWEGSLLKEFWLSRQWVFQREYIGQASPPTFRVSSDQEVEVVVLGQLAFFRPNPKVIKRRIEALIDREYLERDPEVANAYRYLA